MGGWLERQGGGGRGIGSRGGALQVSISYLKSLPLVSFL